jgi:hypothetical protein
MCSPSSATSKKWWRLLKVSDPLKHISIIVITVSIVNSCEDDCWEDAAEEDNEGEGDEEEEEGDEREEEVECAPSGDEQLDEIRRIVSREGGIDNVFPPLDGTAFYDTICKMNHSCVPNAVVVYATSEGRGLVAQVRALRDILEGEEVLQSYIQESLSTEKRQLALRDYGFTCTCSKCSKVGIE